MNIEPPPDHCADCKFFVPGQRVSTEAHDGTCHFSPPGNYQTPHPDNGELNEPDEYGVITFSMVDTTYTGWPLVLASDWCGCYEDRPKPRAAVRRRNTAQSDEARSTE